MRVCVLEYVYERARVRAHACVRASVRICNVSDDLYSLQRLNHLAIKHPSFTFNSSITCYIPKLIVAGAQPVLVSIVVSIPACHAGDRGSIPRLGGILFMFIILLI